LSDDDNEDPDDGEWDANAQIWIRSLAGEQIDARDRGQVDTYACTHQADHVEDNAPLAGTVSVARNRHDFPFYCISGFHNPHGLQN